MPQQNRSTAGPLRPYQRRVLAPPATSIVRKDRRTDEGRQAAAAAAAAARSLSDTENDASDSEKQEAQNESATPNQIRRQSISGSDQDESSENSEGAVQGRTYGRRQQQQEESDDSEGDGGQSVSPLAHDYRSYAATGPSVKYLAKPAAGMSLRAAMRRSDEFDSDESEFSDEDRDREIRTDSREFASEREEQREQREKVSDEQQQHYHRCGRCTKPHPCRCPPGRPGPRGHRGYPGCPGPRGKRGPPGCDGQRGCRGEKGEKGEKGDRGERGHRGFRGEKGERGCPGERGRTGREGPRGCRGCNGKDGCDGCDGRTGPRGAQGPQGPGGIQGAPGRDGRDGAQGPIGPEGKQGIRGPTGPEGKVCCRKRGPTGATGRTGARGATGSAATVWQLVLNKSGSSLDGFTQVAGAWTIAGGNAIATTASGGTNLLRYDTETPQQQQVFDCDILLPSSQVANTSGNAVGLIVGWNGNSPANDSSVFYFLFDTDNSGNPTNARAKVEKFSSGGNVAEQSVSLAVDTVYHVRVIRVGGNMRVYVDDVFVLQGNFSDSVDTGDFIGLWAYAGSSVSVEFSNIKSWSILPPTV